jgi:hypothetical protein
MSSDMLTIVSGIWFAVYGVAGIVVIVWAICAVRKLLRKGGR